MFLLRHAIDSNLDEIFKVFAGNKLYFPHIRKDYVSRRIAGKEVVFLKGVYIIFSKYKRKQRLGNTSAFKDEYILHQIINTVSGNGAASKVWDVWVKTYIKHNLVLTVRSDNTAAKRFYEYKGMRKVGNISWSQGTIAGDVYRLNVIYY